MIDLSAITGGTGVSNTRKGKEDGKQELGQQDFLKLMTTQLKNQDPMSPMENADFMAQIAQFTSASGIQEMQQSFADFTQNMQTNQALQASSLVGRDVVVESGSGWLPEDGQLAGSVVVPSRVENLTLSIADSRGQTVRKLELGAQPAGQVEFAWDGKDGDGNTLPSGSYQLSAHSAVDGDPVSLQTRMHAAVKSVTLSGAGEPPRLNLEGLGELSLSAVRQVK